MMVIVWHTHTHTHTHTHRHTHTHTHIDIEPNPNTHVEMTHTLFSGPVFRDKTHITLLAAVRDRQRETGSR